MMRNTVTLIDDLASLTRENTEKVSAFKKLSDATLNLKKDSESWSILECIEHLNRFGQFYIPEIKQRIAHSKIGPSETFKSGLLGNYFAKSMLPKPDMKKMKSPKAMNPQNSKLSRDVLDTF